MSKDLLRTAIDKARNGDANFMKWVSNLSHKEKAILEQRFGFSIEGNNDSKRATSKK